jgi:hypothetical protein
LAQQYAINTVIEIGSCLLGSAGLNWIQRQVVKRMMRNSNISANRYMPEFIIGNQYTDLLCSQFLVLLGLPIFPAMSLLMSVVLSIQLYVDRVNLLRICRPVTQTKSRFGALLMIMNGINALLAIVCPPTGLLWVALSLNSGGCVYFF